jgi:hypothetical protein
MNKLVSNIRRVLRQLRISTTGTGEIVGVLIAVGVAVTMGYAAVKVIGQAAKDKGEQQQSAVEALPQ